MTKPQINDSTVQPASITMLSNALLARLFSELASNERLIQSQDARIGCLEERVSDLKRWIQSHEERLSYLERKDDEIERLKDENLALRQMVAGDSLDCLSVEDYSV